MADVLAWHRRLGKNHGKYLANRARALLSALFEKAHEIGYKGANPCRGVRKFREESRERYLLPEEVKPFFAALAEEPPLWRDFFLLCLFTGGRKSTIAAMAWKEIIGLEAEEPVWTIPADKSKGGLPITIPLSPPAIAVLRTRRAENGKTPWVFPADTTSGHVVDPRKAWLRTVKRAELTNLRTHDLRRTLGSWQANHGASMAIIGKSLGHGADSKATAVYARLAMDPVRQSVSQAAVALLEAGGEVLDVSSQKERIKP